MRRRLAWCALVGALAAAGWWLFGWTTDSNLPPSRLTSYRFFGKSIRLEMDYDGDGDTEETWYYSWRHSAVHHELPRETRGDRNDDGKVDTWIFVHDQHDLETLARHEVDLDADGDRDWTFVAKWGSGMKEVIRRRGY